MTRGRYANGARPQMGAGAIGRILSTWPSLGTREACLALLYAARRSQARDLESVKLGSERRGIQLIAVLFISYILYDTC